MSLVANILQEVEPTPPSRVRWSDFIVTIDGEEINCKNNMTKAWKLKQDAEASGKTASITKRDRGYTEAFSRAKQRASSGGGSYVDIMKQVKQVPIQEKTLRFG
jgi:hypothetical protein